MPTALITGASGGIGAEFARQLAARKMDLILVARSEDKLNQLAQQLQTQQGIAVEVLVQDLLQPDATRQVYEAVTQKNLTVDLLVNNAGFGDYGDFAERSRDRQLEMLQLNISVLVDLTHRFLIPMRERKSGAIINLASTAAFQPIPYLSVYAATKAFVLSFSEAIWAENRDYNVKVLAVCPGPSETEFFKEAQFPSTFIEGSQRQQQTPVDQVVRESLQALDQGHANVVTGGFANQALVNASRFLPREVFVKAIAQQFKPKG